MTASTVAGAKKGKMNRHQKIILLIAFALLVIFAVSDFESIGGGIIEHLPPGHIIIQDPYSGLAWVLDWLALLIQWAIIVAVYGVALWTARKSTKSN